jgi:putative transposase
VNGSNSHDDQGSRALLQKADAPPRVTITDKPATTPQAGRRILPEVEHRQHKRLNNRAENSHQPGRRERQMNQFKATAQAQRFLAADDGINNFSHRRRDNLTAREYLAARTRALQIWGNVISAAAMAQLSTPLARPSFLVGLR